MTSENSLAQWCDQQLQQLCRFDTQRQLGVVVLSNQPRITESRRRCWGYSGNRFAKPDLSLRWEMKSIIAAENYRQSQRTLR